MTAVDSSISPSVRSEVELLETIAITNQTANSTTVNRAFSRPSWAKSMLILIDITITGTTPLFDFTLSGANTADGRFGAELDSTTDKYEFTAGGPVTITQLTTDTSTPVVAIQIGPGVQTDTTGSATVNSAYAFSCAVLPPWFIYTYITDGTTDDEDYAGTISVIWGR
jgi:hypothetical protein